MSPRVRPRPWSRPDGCGWEAGRAEGERLCGWWLCGLVATFPEMLLRRFTRERRREIMGACWMTGGAYRVPDADGG